MSGKTVLLSAAAVLGLGLLATGCKNYQEQGNAQQVGKGTSPPDDPVYPASSGVHGPQNTIDGRSGVSDPNGGPRGERGKKR